MQSVINDLLARAEASDKRAAECLKWAVASEADAAASRQGVLVQLKQAAEYRAAAAKLSA